MNLKFIHIKRRS